MAVRLHQHSLVMSSTPGKEYHHKDLTRSSTENCRLGLFTKQRAQEQQQLRLLSRHSFSELDSQYSDLQERYDQLVQQCTCSAGLAHRSQMKLAAAESGGDVLSSLVTQPEPNSAPEGTPFKDLFEEVFATLKQTAAVADKLVQRKRNGVMCA